MDYSRSSEPNRSYMGKFEKKSVSAHFKLLRETSEKNANIFSVKKTLKQKSIGFQVVNNKI